MICYNYHFIIQIKVVTKWWKLSGKFVSRSGKKSGNIRAPFFRFFCRNLGLGHGKRQGMSGNFFHIFGGNPAFSGGPDWHFMRRLLGTFLWVMRTQPPSVSVGSFALYPNPWDEDHFVFMPYGIVHTIVRDAYFHGTIAPFSISPFYPQHHIKMKVMCSLARYFFWQRG